MSNEIKSSDSPQGESPPSDPHQTAVSSRSRNARAQARHRAKRKAYIEQLEDTVSKLQIALADRSHHQCIPTSSSSSSAAHRVYELEAENARLRQENNALHSQLESIMPGAHRRVSPIGNGLPTPEDPLGFGVDKIKKRKMTADSELFLDPFATAAAPVGQALPSNGHHLHPLQIPPLPQRSSRSSESVYSQVSPTYHMSPDSSTASTPVSYPSYGGYPLPKIMPSDFVGHGNSPYQLHNGNAHYNYPDSQAWHAYSHQQQQRHQGQAVEDGMNSS